MSEDAPNPTEGQPEPIPAEQPATPPFEQPVPPPAEQPSQAPVEQPAIPPVAAPPQPRAGEVDAGQPPQAGQYFQPYPPQQQAPPNAFDRLIPTKNVKALLAYYFGVFGIVPCFSPLLSPAAIILGILGLSECKRDPNLPGKGHAIAGIVLGSIMTLVLLTVLFFVVMANANRPASGY